MANLWFRLYSEFEDDPKVQMMSEPMQRRLIMLMCRRCKGETLHETQMAFHWRISEREVAETKATFMLIGFIDSDWNLINWNRRQFISDSSTDRTRQHRQRKKQSETSQSVNVTANVTNGNVTVTAPDTDTEADTDSEAEAEAESTFALSAIALPAGLGVFELPLPGDGKEWAVPQKLFDEMKLAYPDLSVMGELAKMRAWLIANPANRKTPKGLPRFINSWLDKAQNRPGGGRNYGNTKAGRADGNAEVIRALMVGTEEDGDPGLARAAGGGLRPEADADDVPTLRSGDDGLEHGGDRSGVRSSDGGVQVFPVASPTPRIQWPRRNG
jgi:hypothetical protein